MNTWMTNQRDEERAHTYVLQRYTRSPLQDSRLFEPSPWEILATTYEQQYF